MFASSQCWSCWSLPIFFGFGTPHEGSSRAMRIDPLVELSVHVRMWNCLFVLILLSFPRWLPHYALFACIEFCQKNLQVRYNGKGVCVSCCRLHWTLATPHWHQWFWLTGYAQTHHSLDSICGLWYCWLSRVLVCWYLCWSTSTIMIFEHDVHKGSMQSNKVLSTPWNFWARRMVNDLLWSIIVRIIKRDFY